MIRLSTTMIIRIMRVPIKDIIINSDKDNDDDYKRMLLMIKTKILTFDDELSPVSSRQKCTHTFENKNLSFKFLFHFESELNEFLFLY